MEKPAGYVSTEKSKPKTERGVIFSRGRAISEIFMLAGEAKDGYCNLVINS